MRGDAEAHQLIAPGTLVAVLELLASAPGEWTPIAGGTELMMAHAAGRLTAPKLVSLWGLRDLRFINVQSETIALGAGTTFSDLRTHTAVATDLPLLVKAAAWIGSIATCLLHPVVAFAGELQSTRFSNCSRHCILS